MIAPGKRTHRGSFSSAGKDFPWGRGPARPSPFEKGEREDIPQSSQPNIYLPFAKHSKAFPLPIGWGEGQGEGFDQLNTHD